MAYFKLRLNIHLFSVLQFIFFKDFKKVIFLFLFFNFSFQEIEKCPKDIPIKYQNECNLKYCTESEYQNGNCVVNNDIIKSQWLNNIILIGDISYKYSYPYFDLNNNLIIVTY